MTRPSKIDPVPEFQRSRFDGRIARDQELTGTDLRVALILSEHSNKEGTCYPGNKLIAAELGIDVRRVGRSLESLERHGHISRVPREPGQHRWLRLIGGGYPDTEMHSEAPRYPGTEGGGYPQTEGDGHPDAEKGRYPDTHQNYTENHALNHPQKKTARNARPSSSVSPQSEPEPDSKGKTGHGTTPTPTSDGEPSVAAGDNPGARGLDDHDIDHRRRLDGGTYLIRWEPTSDRKRLGVAQFGSKPYSAGVFDPGLAQDLQHHLGEIVYPDRRQEGDHVKLVGFETTEERRAPRFREVRRLCTDLRGAEGDQGDLVRTLVEFTEDPLIPDLRQRLIRWVEAVLGGESQVFGREGLKDLLHQLDPDREVPPAPEPPPKVELAPMVDAVKETADNGTKEPPPETSFTRPDPSQAVDLDDVDDLARGFDEALSEPHR